MAGPTELGLFLKYRQLRSASPKARQFAARGLVAIPARRLSRKMDFRGRFSLLAPDLEYHFAAPTPSRIRGGQFCGGIRGIRITEFLVYDAKYHIAGPKACAICRTVLCDGQHQYALYARQSRRRLLTQSFDGLDGHSEQLSRRFQAALLVNEWFGDHRALRARLEQRAYHAKVIH